MSEPAEVSVLLSEEQLHTEVSTQVTGSVVLRRRVVTELVTIEVEVSREELVVERRGGHGQAAPARDGAPAPTVVVLREQVPEVYLRTRAYERVTVHTDVVEELVDLEAQVSHEEVELVEEPQPVS